MASVAPLEPNFLIVGPGALGSYFAARLGQKFRKLWVLDHRPARAKELQDRGFHVTGASVLDWVAQDGRVSSETRGWPKMDVIFLMVKSPAIPSVARNVASLATPKTVMVALQNGWGIEKLLTKKWSPRQIVRGITHEAVTLMNVGRAFQAAAGTTFLNAHCPQTPRIAKIMATAGFRIKIEKNFEHASWLKLIVNAAANPIGALADVTNGRLLEAPLFPLLEQVLAECVQLSAALKHPITIKEARKHLEDVLRATAANRNSMAQDLTRGRATERGVILGPFLDAAKKSRKAAPTLIALDRLLKSVEEISLS